MSRNDSQRQSDRCPGLVPAWTALGAVGRIVLLQRRGAPRIAAADGGAAAGRTRGNDPAAGVKGLPNTFSGRSIRLETIFRDRASQQRPAGLSDRHRTDLYDERTG